MTRSLPRDVRLIDTQVQLGELVSEYLEPFQRFVALKVEVSTRTLKPKEAKPLKRFARIGRVEATSLK